MSDWFCSWFDSSYYHKLYKHRDNKEAEEFINNLLSWLKIPAGGKVADIPCGKGRHCIYLNSHGFDVTGVDLSPESITEASKHTSPTLRFLVGDIRKLNFNEEFEVVFNLFTSFGYFDDEQDNILAMKNLARAVKHGGRLVVDFMNINKVLNTLVASEEKEIDGILFSIRRFEKNGILVKTIQITDGNKKYNFEERVKIIRLDDFKNYLNHCNLAVVATFGSYQLNSFDQESSDRLILIAQKN